MQLKILTVTKQNGYIEVGYEATLDVPLAQQAGRGGATIIKTGTIGYTNGTSATAIKADMVTRLNAAQTELNNDTTYQYYGTIYNGTSWITP
jgi:hypothetical protein